MNMRTAIAVYVPMALAFVVCIGNWCCVLADYRLKRQGSKRHVSTVPLVAQILVVIAALVGRGSNFPIWIYLIVAFSDPALYLLLSLLFITQKKPGGTP
jgi:hypothetical protein